MPSCSSPLCCSSPVVLFFAPMLGHLLSPMVLSLTRRLMGLILASIAMEMIVGSLGKLFPGWLH